MWKHGFILWKLNKRLTQSGFCSSEAAVVSYFYQMQCKSLLSFLNPSILPRQEVLFTSCPSSSGWRAEARSILYLICFVFSPRQSVFPVPVFGLNLSAGLGFTVPVSVLPDEAELFLENRWGYHNREGLLRSLAAGCFPFSKCMITVRDLFYTHAQRVFKTLSLSRNLLSFNIHHRPFVPFKIGFCDKIGNNYCLIHVVWWLFEWP